MNGITNIKNFLAIYFIISGLAINLIAIPKCLTGKAAISVTEKNFFITTETEEGEE